MIRDRWRLEQKSELCRNQPPPPAPRGATDADPEGLLEIAAKARRLAAREVVSMFGSTQRDLYRKSPTEFLAACASTVALYEDGFLNRLIQTRFDTVYEQRRARAQLRELEKQSKPLPAYLP